MEHPQPRRKRQRTVCKNSIILYIKARRCWGLWRLRVIKRVSKSHRISSPTQSLPNVMPDDLTLFILFLKTFLLKTTDHRRRTVPRLFLASLGGPGKPDMGAVCMPTGSHVSSPFMPVLCVVVVTYLANSWRDWKKSSYTFSANLKKQWVAKNNNKINHFTL